MNVAEKLARWRLDHVKAVEELFPRMRGKLDIWQKKALAYCSRRDRSKRLCLSASAGVGKTSVEAWEAWIRLSCYGDMGEHPQGIAIAVDGRNLAANLQKEMSKWYQESELLQRLFEETATRFRSREYPKTWFLEFRSFPRSANEDEKGASLSGLHSKFPFIIMDESATIPAQVGLRAEQAFSVMEDGLIIQAGNPISPNGCLYDAMKRRSHLWHCMSVTSDPLDPDRCTRIPVEWAQEQIDAAPLGRQDPWVQAYVLGRFPDQAINTLMSADDVDEAMKRSVEIENYEWASKVIGVDVAGDGLDESVIAKRQGRVIYPLIAMRGVNSTDGATRVARIWNEWKADGCFVDAGGGFGGAWRDRLVGHGYSAQQVAFSGTPADPRYFNKRAEMFYHFAQWVKEGGSLPKDERLRKECIEITYTHHSDKLLIVDKKRLKAQLGHSPDRSDACILTFAAPLAPRINPYDPIQQISQRTSKVKTGLRGRLK